MIYGYARCSTNENKQDITRQIRELVDMGVEEKNIFLEYESGTKLDRNEYTRLLETVVAGDCIVTTEVSRLSRSTRQLCDLATLVEKKKLKLVIKNSLTIDCTASSIDPMTKAFLQITGVFAELERDMISARVKSGLNNARAKGKRIGRPQLEFDQLPDKFLRYYALYQSQELSIAELARLAEVSRPTVYRYISILQQT